VSVNVTRDISLMVLDVMLIATFGTDYERVVSHFVILSDEAARDLRFAQAFRSLGNLVAQIIIQRRKERRTGTDILGLLMEARDRKNGQPMPDRQIISEIMTLVVAGHETTASTLNWAWYLLSQNSSVEEKLSQELAAWRNWDVLDFDQLPKFIYTRQVLEEVLRLYPAGWLMTRRALKDDRLGDYFVPAGTEIYISPYFIQRHPGLWERPDDFDPDRFESGRYPQRHPLVMIPFSAGPRNCIGEFFARVEMQIHVMLIARHLRLRYVGSEPPELEAGVNLRSKHDITMTMELRPQSVANLPI
jgi:cytochrome P450